MIKPSPSVLIVAGVLFAATASLTASGLLPSVPVRGLPDDSSYGPAFRVASGHELALIFIGASMCRAANRDTLRAVLEELKLEMRRRAAASDRSFAAIGVARDWDVWAGVRYLQSFGQFDEIFIGRGWLNSAIIKYVWTDLPGEAATPQIIVVDRTVSSPTVDSVIAGYSISDERLIVRKVGVSEILQWHRNGAPVPPLAASGGG